MEERKRRAAAFISDRRMGAAAQRLRAQGAEVLEVWNRESFAKLQEMAGELDWLMLPIRGLDAEGCAQLEGESYPLADILEELPRERPSSPACGQTGCGRWPGAGGSRMQERKFTATLMTWKSQLRTQS